MILSGNIFYYLNFFHKTSNIFCYVIIENQPLKLYYITRPFFYIIEHITGAYTYDNKKTKSSPSQGK